VIGIYMVGVCFGGSINCTNLVVSPSTSVIVPGVLSLEDHLVLNNNSSILLKLCTFHF
jgi:hypothetical protein